MSGHYIVMLVSAYTSDIIQNITAHSDKLWDCYSRHLHLDGLKTLRNFSELARFAAFPWSGELVVVPLKHNLLHARYVVCALGLAPNHCHGSCILEAYNCWTSSSAIQTGALVL